MPWHPEAIPAVEAAPPPDLQPASFAARLYIALSPLTLEEPELGWPLLIYVNAIGRMFQLVEDWVRDTPDGPGWSLLLDVNRCPPEALPWLAQLVGVRLLQGSTVEEQRERIASTDGFKRGTAAAMRGAALATLTGQRSVVFRERAGDPAQSPEYAYILQVSTYANETPDPDATLAALLSQKPGGILLEYRVLEGQDYGTVRDTNATYQAVRDRYPDYASMRSAAPIIPQQRRAK